MPIRTPGTPHPIPFERTSDTPEPKAAKTYVTNGWNVWSRFCAVKILGDDEGD